MLKKFISLDYLGILVASACFLHCLGALFVLAGFATSSIIFLRFLDNPQMHVTFILLSVILGIISLLIVYMILRRSSQLNKSISLTLILAVSFLLTGLLLDIYLFSNVANILLLSGAVFITLLHVQLIKVKRTITD